MTALIADLRRAARGEVVEQAPLAPRTSVRVGGPARVWVKPGDPGALVEVLGILSASGMPWFSLGGGANTIVGDAGVNGAVLRLGQDFASEEVEEAGDHVVLTLGAGAPIARFLSLSREQRCVGVAWAAGIPGTVGGLVAMNAGTPAGCMADHLLAAEVATPSGLRWIEAKDLHLGYRHCELPRGSVLTRARCRVRRGSEGELLEQQRLAKADVDRRRATQPLTLPNSGSVFVNPPGDFAGRLIEKAGLKGKTVGGAQISERHANFIVNLGGAKAADVIELIVAARRAVRAASGIELKPEVRLVGDFVPPLPAELEPHHVLPLLLGQEAQAFEISDPAKSCLRVQP
ncbi:MAG TPA: UDP-N-acetylmuramate dehydrogenase [Myxococcales bacterium]|nr:UDP-N-acetylmuramate dehydrogenase [Myxococcales bacterium]